MPVDRMGVGMTAKLPYIPDVDEANRLIGRLVAALDRLLGSVRPGNADDHTVNCMCVIHEARKALAAARNPGGSA